jgi:glycosyltransferase involved in cell wall biosynthesis
MIKVSCIVPAYNEEKRIGSVLEIVSKHPLIDEVIVVDDASKDNTKDVALKFEKVKLIVHEKNRGKSASLYDAIKKSTGTFLFFLDADLIGITSQNLTDLITPVVNGQSGISISLRRNSPRLWHMLGIDYISGERVLPRTLLEPYLEEILSLRFGFEVFLNKLIIKNGLKVKIVLWPNVDSPYKYKKDGLWGGIKGDILMFRDILKTVPFWGLIYQIVKLRKLRVK